MAVSRSSDCPEPRAPLRCLRVKHDAANDMAVVQDNVIILTLSNGLPYWLRVVLRTRVCILN